MLNTTLCNKSSLLPYVKKIVSRQHIMAFLVNNITYTVVSDFFGNFNDTVR